MYAPIIMSHFEYYIGTKSRDKSIWLHLILYVCFSRRTSPTYHPLTSFLQLNYFRPHNIPNSNETKPEIPHQHLAVPT
jgi:hypothetical protein